MTCFPEKSTSRSMSLRSAPAPYSFSLENCWAAVSACLSCQTSMAEKQELEQARPQSCSPLKTTGIARQGKSSCRKTSASSAGLELDLCLQLLPVQAGEGNFALQLFSFARILCFAAFLHPCTPASSQLPSCARVPFLAAWILLLSSHSSRGISPSSL